VHWQSSFEKGTLKGFPNPPAMGSGGQSPPAPDAIRLAKVALLVAALALGGCSLSKWTVKPHQRELLADKIMQLDAEPQERSAEEHVLANREGAIGGTGTSGGGCGCN
jgi:uncharacterized protein DUF4266